MGRPPRKGTPARALGAAVLAADERLELLELLVDLGDELRVLGLVAVPWRRGEDARRGVEASRAARRMAQRSSMVSASDRQSAFSYLGVFVSTGFAARRGSGAAVDGGSWWFSTNLLRASDVANSGRYLCAERLPPPADA